MNILNILKSRIGALSISAGKTAGLALTVGLVGMNFYSYMNSSSAAQEERIRSFSEILSSGGSLPGDTTMSFSTGNAQFATAEEIAAREGSSTLFDGGEGAVTALNNFNVSGRTLGAGDSGLGMGANAAVQLDADGKPVMGGDAADGSAVAAAAAQANQTKINKLGEAKEGDLQRASMARASGSNLGSGSRGGFGASSGASGSSASSKSVGQAARVGDGYSLSGAMPGGSTLIASNSGIRGIASSSSFGASDAQTRIGKGVNSKEGRSLRDIALASSKVAANKNRAANEGTSPFMAKEKLSGGINVVGDVAPELQGSSSTEFEDNLKGQETSLDQGISEIDTTEQEKQAHRNRLATAMVALLFTTMAAMIAI